MVIPVAVRYNLESKEGDEIREKWKEPGIRYNQQAK